MEKKQTEPKHFSSEHIENENLTLTSETLYSKYCFDTKIQSKFDESNKRFE